MAFLLYHFSLWEYVCEYGLHTVEVYSICGRTMVLYSVSEYTCMFSLFISIKPSDLLAFELILFIYVLKFKLVDKSKP